LPTGVAALFRLVPFRASLRVHQRFSVGLSGPRRGLRGDNRTGHTIAPEERWEAVSDVAGREGVITSPDEIIFRTLATRTSTS